MIAATLLALAPQTFTVDNDSPGDTLQVDVFGRSGMPMWVFFSVVPTLLALPTLFGERLLISPTSIVASSVLTLAGQQVAATESIDIPIGPALLGLTFDDQGFVPKGASWLLTNSHQVVLH
jgi:hypothetical protein